MPMNRLALVTAAFVFTACANAPVDEPGDGDEALLSAEATSHDDGDEASSEEFVEKAACGSRWTLPSHVSQAGNEQSVSYEGAGNRCAGGATDGALKLAQYLRSAFAGQLDFDIPGDGVQIYNCRKIVGGSSLSVHATGRALDVFIPTGRGGAADNARGDMVANWLVENADRIGVQMIIWDRTIWKASGGVPRDRCYQGSHPHNDHVHVEISDDAANLDTPFFRGEQAPPPSDGPADSPELPPVSGDEPPLNRNAWVGDLCRHDNDCAFSTDSGLGRCFLSHQPVSGQGFCTVDCAGYCADRDGKAVTFCVNASLLGGGGGVCVSKAGSANDWCSDPSGFTSVEANRYVGRSGARNASAEVCLPNGR